jgi:3-oxoacyl-[acyl-carrier-protein] synthase III
MPKRYSAITGVSGWVPETVLTNAALEKMVDTTDAWIVRRTGVSERRVLDGPGLGTSDIGAAAVKGLLAKTNTNPDQIDLLICATVTGDMHTPDTANIICDKIGIRNAFAFDINAACSGFLYALIAASKFIESGSHSKVVVVGADNATSLADYTDSATCVLFGDGGGAVLLEPHFGPYGIRDSSLHSDGAGRQHLYVKAGGSVKPASIETVEAREHYLYQGGKPVFKAAVKNMGDVIQEVIDRNNLDGSLHWLIPHQANIRILEAVADRIQIPIDRVAINIQRYGNTSSGSIPLCLWEWEPFLKRGDNVILAAFGAGFTWGAIYLRWAIQCN